MLNRLLEILTMSISYGVMSTTYDQVTISNQNRDFSHSTKVMVQLTVTCEPRPNYSSGKTWNTFCDSHHGRVNQIVSDEQPIPTPEADSSTLALLTSAAEAHRQVASLEATLYWRYLSKANLSFRPSSPQGQKALEAALRSAQGTLTLTKDGQARLEVTTPGKDALPRAKTLTREREIK